MTETVTEGNRDTPETSAPNSKGEDAAGTAAHAGANAARSPEEESQSELPGDPRPPHATQPPTKEQF